MIFHYHPEAEKELLHSVRYYENEVVGLGAEFLDAIEQSLAIIQSFPDMGTLLTKSERRIMVERFPFAIIYSTHVDRTMIYAIMHLKRKPGYWKSRT